MDVQSKLNEAIKDMSASDRKALGAYFAFANRHLTQAIRAVKRMNKTLKQIRHDLER